MTVTWSRFRCLIRHPSSISYPSPSTAIHHHPSPSITYHHPSPSAIHHRPSTILHHPSPITIHHHPLSITIHPPSTSIQHYQSNVYFHNGVFFLGPGVETSARQVIIVCVQSELLELGRLACQLVRSMPGRQVFIWTLAGRPRQRQCLVGHSSSPPLGLQPQGSTLTTVRLPGGADELLFFAFFSQQNHRITEEEICKL